MKIGVDIVEVTRIKNAIEKNNGFLEKVFTKKEIEYCEKRKNKYQSYAGRFSAKEDFVKAIGTGFNNEISFKDIEILNDDNKDIFEKFEKEIKEIVERIIKELKK